MTYLNSNIPPIEGFVRGNFLRQQKDSHEIYLPCLIFGVSSIPSQVPLFNILMEDGGIYWHLPISAFCSKVETPSMELGDLVLWDSFSYNVAVTTFYVLQNKIIEYIDRHGVRHVGKYLFTLDWSNGDYNEFRFGFAESAGQHKTGHLIELENGNYAIQPNNRIKVFDPSFTVKKDFVIERLLNIHTWSVENAPKFITEDSEKYNYEIKTHHDKVK